MFNCDYFEHLCIINTEPCLCIYQELKHFSKSIYLILWVWLCFADCTNSFFFLNSINL